MTVELKNLVMNDRQICDLELLLNDAFQPLTGFMDELNYNSVLKNMRLSSGELWPIPITLDVTKKIKTSLNLKLNSKIALRDKEGFLVATLRISSMWKIDKLKEAKLVYNTTDKNHPGVNYLFNQVGEYYIGGDLELNELPKHYDYQLFRHSPVELKKQFKKLGWDKVVAFQTRNPMHRAHKEISFTAAKENGANLLLHPVVGPTKPGDIDHYTRVRCYQRIIKYFPEGTTMLSLLPLAMRMAGPREALWHALIRKNYGCTHIIIGRDHAGPGNNQNGKPYYGPYDAQKIVSEHEDEIGIKMVPFKMMVYVKDVDKYMEIDKVPKKYKSLSISGTELRHRLENNQEIPDWFSYSDIVDELHKVYPPKDKQGFTVFFSGLSGSGKSTIANGLLVKLLEHGNRRVTLLDGDIVRTHLSSELGFSKEHREINVKRIGYVASEITKNGGIAICAPIAPFKESRQFNRKLISNLGTYIQVHVSTPLKECERRDVKGLYAKARAGILKGFTGIDDPYETPESSELKIDTTNISPEQAVQEVMLYLEQKGFIK
ncbi:MAG: adenylyltransferase [Candidatus Marinimicrobia bacterium]|nr:adenylyltransferase [Candidatus Neomarinimicrobiota bacterium]|tara:strand:- start:28026 stop:29663 length:1638 start_codon:yes stop_codon:yes gene_type:complete